MRPGAYRDFVRQNNELSNLPLSGTHLIIGSPGTGKTIFAIHRAEQLKQAGLDTQFLVYNNPLRQYLSQLLENLGLEAQSATYHSWFWRWYKTNLGKEPPVGQDKYTIDWMTAWTEIGAAKGIAKIDHLVIDEGQDFPREFYVLARTITRNLTVFADENQRITGANSTTAEIQGYLGIPSIIRLTKNHRNTRPIAEFAQAFYPGPVSDIPQLPEKAGPKPVVISVVSRASGQKAAPFNGLRIQCRLIADYCIEHSEKTIGIFIPTWDHQAEIATRLADSSVENIQVYKDNRQKANLDFSRPKVTLVRYGTAKGLEFDTVFLPDLDQNTDEEMERSQTVFYVLCSRARHELLLMYTGLQMPQILSTVNPELFSYKQITG